MNNKIEPHYVDFATAKWLKEKGFDVPCKQRFWVGFENEEHFQGDCISNNWNDYDDSSTVYYSVPEQHQVIEWLRINHGIWIQVNISRYGIFYCNILQNQLTKNINLPMSYEMVCQLNDFNTPQEAYSAAFDYIRLNNLI